MSGRNWDEKPNQCCYKGEWFDTAEETMEYAKKWPDLQVDLEKYRKFLDNRFEEAKMNLEMRGSLTNRESYKLLFLSLDMY